MRIVTTMALILGAAGLLTACGSGDEQTSAAATAGSAKAEKKKGDATAEEVAREARGKVNCSKVKAPARAPGAPVDDVVNVRPGMTYDEAVTAVLCSHDLMVVTPENSRRFDIQTYGHTIRQGFTARFAEPRVQKTSQQILAEMQDSALARGTNRRVNTAKPGQSRWYVATMGVPGEERVISVAREEWFEEERYPTMASVEQALVGKYGTPTTRADAPTVVELTWAYDPQGRPVRPGSNLSRQCRAQPNPDGATRFSTDCGLAISATIYRLRSNPALSERIGVGVMDQARGYEAITGTERKLQQLDAQRRAREVEEAAKKAAGPQL